MSISSNTLDPISKDAQGDIGKSGLVQNSAATGILSPKQTSGVQDESLVERAKWAVDEDAVAGYLAAHTGPVVVDLDETLYLRNSTEEFIGLAAPSILSAYLLRFLDVVAPWRFIGGHHCRDNWRILLVLFFFPWTYLRWKKHCENHVPRFVNQKLRDALRAYSKHIVIASNGYELLLRPMIKAFDLPSVALVSCHLLRFKHRRDGKLTLLDTAHDREFISKSLVVTDSYTDAPLLRVCQTPCLTVWRDALYQRAFDGLVYLPTDYLSRVKRPRQGALRSLVIYDLVPWILVGLSVTPHVLDVVGLFALFLSMWAIYEVGYFDNDQCAVLYESDPKLTLEAQQFKGRFFRVKAWLTAVVLGAIAVACIEPNDFAPLFIAWMLTLLALNGVYWIYNRIDKTTRTWLYPVLQLFRFGALMTILPIAAIGYAAIFAQVFCRWVKYIIYRQQRSVSGEAKWPKTADQSIRLVTFLVLALPIVLKGQWYDIMVPASACLFIFAYGFWKYDWKTFREGVHRLDKKRA